MSRTGNYVCVSLICEKKEKRIQTNRWFLLLILGCSDSESTFFLTLVLHTQIQYLSLSSLFALPCTFAFVRDCSIILRELLFAIVFAFLLLCHLSDAITSRLFYIWCVSERKTNAKMVPRRLIIVWYAYPCLARAHTLTQTHFAHAHFTYFNKQKASNK